MRSCFRPAIPFDFFIYLIYKLIHLDDFQLLLLNVSCHYLRGRIFYNYNKFHATERDTTSFVARGPREREVFEQALSQRSSIHVQPDSRVELVQCHQIIKERNYNPS